MYKQKYLLPKAGQEERRGWKKVARKENMLSSFLKFDKNIPFQIIRTSSLGSFRH